MPDPSPDALREAFEQWYETKFTLPHGYLSRTRKTNGEYRSSLYDAWLAWQAATRTALEQAAQACEDLALRPPVHGNAASICAAAVRSLIPRNGGE